MAPMTSTMALPDFGLRTDDIRYFHMDTRIQGRGPNRLKYLDLEGRWVLSGSSIPFISTAFRHLENLNSAKVPFRDYCEEPLNAIGMVGWTPSSEPAQVEKTEERKRPSFVLRPPVVIEDDEVPPSPREIMPHRSAGYGSAHIKRKLSIPDRSRSASPQYRNESPAPDYDKYAKFERNRKDSITRYGTRWGDQGYSSSSPSPTGEQLQYPDRIPHRTQAILVSPRSAVTYDTPYRNHSSDYADRPYKDELIVKTKEEKTTYVPYRTTGYGAYHVKRQYDISPRSMGTDSSATSGSEQSSPSGGNDRNADEIMLMAYHSKGNLPRLNNRTTFMQH